MTKQEILQKNYSEGIKANGVTSISTVEFPLAYKGYALKAMVEYARQEAIGFGPWLGRSAFYVPANKKWYATPDMPFYKWEGHTLDELYDIYLQQKQQP